jgi:integrase
MPKKPASRLGVKKRGKRWQARPYFPGVGHKWAGTHDTKDEAIEAAEAKVAEFTTRPPRQETIWSFFCGIPDGPPKDQRVRVLRDYPRAKDSTNDSYEGIARRFAERVDPDDKRKLDEYTVPEALAYGRKYPADIYPLRAMFGDARREGLLRRDQDLPFSALGISKGRGRKDIVAITEEELDLLIEIAYEEHSNEFAPVFASVIDFAAATTMRPSEIFGLDRPDVDLKAEAVNIQRQFHKRRIQPPKNGEPRRLPYLPPRASQAVRHLPRRVPPPICEVTGGEILFYGKEGQRITQPALHSYWKPVRAAFEAKLPLARRDELRAARNPKYPQMDFYELRHFGATQMAERGIEDWVGAEMMGHTDGGKLFRETYSHPANRVAGQRLKQAFGRGTARVAGVEEESRVAHA